jgi:hypothetical protein
MPHGGLLVMPSEFVWLEWRQTDDVTGERYRVGAMLKDCEDSITYEITSSIDHTVIFKGRIMYEADECAYVVVKQSQNDDVETCELAGLFGVIVVVYLLIINAPYGIDKEPAAVHKVWAKEAKQRGFTLKPYHYVRLSKKPPPSDLAKGQGPAFHKAFHFVRGHLRRYQSGLKVMVKAHWRGDPRLGVCAMPDYKVKP